MREYNYCQIFRKMVEVPKLFIKTHSSFNPNDRSYLRKKKGIELLRDFECSMLFGVRDEDTSNCLRTMGGITYFNKLYSTISRRASLNMRESTFENFLREIFSFGSAYRTFLCGYMPPFMRKSKTIRVPISKSYGIPVTQYLSPHGTFNVIKDPVLNDFGVFVDLSSLKYRPLAHRGPVLRTETQNPGDDFRRDTYLAEWTFELHAPERGTIIGTPGIADAVAIPEGSSFDTKFTYKPSLDEILGIDQW